MPHDRTGQDQSQSGFPDDSGPQGGSLCFGPKRTPKAPPRLKLFALLLLLLPGLWFARNLWHYATWQRIEAVVLDRRIVHGDEDDSYFPCVRFHAADGTVRYECVETGSNLYDRYTIGTHVGVFASPDGTGFLFDDWRLKLCNLILVAPGLLLLWGIRAYENGTIQINPIGSEEEDS